MAGPDVGMTDLWNEDAHWADDATPDLLKFLGRRTERTRALLTISFRDDEVTASRPLRRVIGELPPAATHSS
jgi:predicted ATPase